MSRLKRVIMSVIAALALVSPLASPALVSAQDIDQNLSCGANLNFSGDGNCETDEAGKTAGDRVDNVVTQVINIVSLLVGVAAVIMIMVGGLRYVTSNGDSGQVGNAKNTILYAVVGLVVVALAQIIVRFVVSKAVAPSEE